MGSYAFLRNSLAYPICYSPNCPQDSTKFTHVPLKSHSSSSVTALSVQIPPNGYRRNVGICLVSPSKKIFAGARINIPDTWQMPQGGAGEGEDLRNAAMRELREETGVISAEFLAEAPYWLTYDFPLPVRDRLNRRWGTNYKGQAQKWFLFKFTGKEEEINLLGDGSEKPEFNKWAWMLPERVVELAVDFKRPIYEEVMNLFNPYLQADTEVGKLSAHNGTKAKVRIKKWNQLRCRPA